MAWATDLFVFSLGAIHLSSPVSLRSLRALFLNKIGSVGCKNRSAYNLISLTPPSVSGFLH